MTYEQARNVVGPDFDATMAFVEGIRRSLPGAEYEAIAKRKKQSVPTALLAFDDCRVLLFDLYLSSTKVYFAMREWLPPEVVRRFAITPERNTGRMGFTLEIESDPNLPDALNVITDYWNDCATAIASGRSEPRWKKQHFVETVARRTFPAEIIITDKKSIDGSNCRPDVYVPGQRLVIHTDGAQHYSYVPRFHATPGAFASQRERDASIDRLCVTNGISVLRVVGDAAYFLTPQTLPEYVARAAAAGRVLYLTRKGQALNVSETRPDEES